MSTESDEVDSYSDQHLNGQVWVGGSWSFTPPVRAGCTMYTWALISRPVVNFLSSKYHIKVKLQ